MLPMPVARQLYVLPVLRMSSICTSWKAYPSQQVTSLRRRVQVNAPAAYYWLRRVLDDGGR